MEVTFTFDFAWILYPVIGILSFSALLSLTFGLVFGFANGKNFMHSVIVASRIAFSIAGVVMAYAWLYQSLYRALDKT